MQQRTVEQLADDVPMLTLLDSPVPQVVDHLVAVLAGYDTPIPEQVIELPKISCPPRFSRTVLGTPQMAEQLVEVPTILCFLQQEVDIPVGAGGGSGGGQPRFLPRQSFSSTAEQTVDNPAPCHGVAGGHLSSLLHQGPLQRTAEQIVDIPVSRTHDGGRVEQIIVFGGVSPKTGFNGVLWT